MLNICDRPREKGPYGGKRHFEKNDVKVDAFILRDKNQHDVVDKYAVCTQRTVNFDISTFRSNFRLLLTLDL